MATPDSRPNEPTAAVAKGSARRSRARYRPGPRIYSLHVAIEMIEQGRPLYCYGLDRPRPAAFLAQQRLALLIQLCRHGHMRHAFLIDGEGGR